MEIQRSIRKLERQPLNILIVKKSHFSKFATDINKRLLNQLMDHCWGGELEIVAISELYGVRIVIWKLSSRRPRKDFWQHIQSTLCVTEMFIMIVFKNENVTSNGAEMLLKSGSRNDQDGSNDIFLDDCLQKHSAILSNTGEHQKINSALSVNMNLVETGPGSIVSSAQVTKHSCVIDTKLGSPSAPACWCIPVRNKNF